VHGRIHWQIWVAAVFLAVLYANVWLAPGADVRSYSSARPDVIGVAAALTAVFTAASIIAIGFFHRVASARRPTRDSRRDVRDGAWLIGILGTGSLLPMTVTALMRDDSKHAAPIIGFGLIVMIVIAAFSVALVLSMAISVTSESRSGPGRSS
jgi:hypothetical protein